MALRELHLFAGAGGGILGGMLLGHVPVCAVEVESYPRRVLLQRQLDGILPRFPIWDDVRTFDGHAWRGRADVICGGFPCQDISSAGKGAGIDGERSGLWSEFARIIGEVQPALVFIENSPLLVSRGLHRVLGDLAALGFDAEWGVLGAHHTGAPHKRDRIWILGHSNSNGQSVSPKHGEASGVRGLVAHAPSLGREPRRPEPAREQGRPDAFECCASIPDTMRIGWREALSGSETQRREPYTYQFCPPTWWATEPALGRVAHGVAHRVDRLKAIGNGQVPAVAALAWTVLWDRIQQRREAVA